MITDDLLEILGKKVRNFKYWTLIENKDGTISKIKKKKDEDLKISKTPGFDRFVKENMLDEKVKRKVNIKGL